MHRLLNGLARHAFVIIAVAMLGVAAVMLLR
jgi:hypothetical protein